MRAALNPRSGNAKTGPIAVWETSSDTCPRSCGQWSTCYAKQHHASRHWARLDSGERGVSFPAFLEALERLPAGGLARGNQWGDQPGDGESLDVPAFRALVSRASRLRAWSYSHYPLTLETVREFRSAAALGYTVNASADTISEADAKAATGLPTVVVLPSDAPKVGATPAGRRVVVCPAQTSERVTCETCGNGRPLCYRAERDYVIGFRAHGAKAGEITRRLRVVP